MSRHHALLLLAIALATLAAACTGGGESSTASATPGSPPTATPTLEAATTPLTPVATSTPRLPWQLGEPIPLTLSPHVVTAFEVTPATILPARDELDRSGGVFAWERSTDRLLFLEGLQRLYIAPELVDGRPIGLAWSDLEDGDPRSLVVRFDPVEVMALPLGFNVLGGPFDDPWSGPASVRVLPWRLDPVDGRSLPDGEYTLDLASSTLTLVRETPRGASSKRLIQEAWPARPVGAAMVLQSGRRSLHLGLDGSGEEVAGHVDRWLLAPDGTRLLMVTARSQLVVYEFATQRSWVLGGPTAYGAVEWSPTGQHISATIFEPFGDSWTTVVFDAMRLDDLVSQPLDYWAPDDQPLLLIEETWSWRWRGSTELFVGADGGLSLLDVETGSLRSIRLDRQPYDTLAWDATTSTLAHSRVRGVPVSVIDLDNGGAWFDIPLLAASPQLGLFDMTGAPRDSGSR